MESPQELFLQTLAATGDRIAAIRIIRELFGLDPGQAKEVMLQAEGTAKSIDGHQERIAVQLEQFLEKGKPQKL
jgi:hypothetical protein